MQAFWLAAARARQKLKSTAAKAIIIRGQIFVIAKGYVDGESGSSLG
jgi:hypothetical protein